MGAILVWLEDAWYWVVGDLCPVCGEHCWEWRHDCKALRGLSTEQAVAFLTHKVRNILDDEPADKFVHTAYEAIDKLDKAFGETDHGDR